ncbi:hypothetical protein NKG94_40870 [Micromonospora sp. M12]
MATDLPADARRGGGQHLGTVALDGRETTESALPLVEELPEPVPGAFGADLVGEVEQAGGDQMVAVGRGQRGAYGLVAAEPDQQVGDLVGGGDGATAAGLCLEDLIARLAVGELQFLGGEELFGGERSLVGVAGVEGQPFRRGGRRAGRLAGVRLVRRVASRLQAAVGEQRGGAQAAEGEQHQDGRSADQHLPHPAAPRRLGGSTGVEEV